MPKFRGSSLTSAPSDGGFKIALLRFGLAVCLVCTLALRASAQNATPAPSGTAPILPKSALVQDQSGDATTAPSAADSQQISATLMQAAQLTDDEKKQIDAAVAAELGSAADPNTQTLDQQWLGKPSQTGNATPAFLDAYAQSVNDHLLTLIQSPDTKFRAKIEIGIAATVVAQNAHNTQLLPLITALLNDKSSAVSLVGVRASAKIMPYLFAQGNDKLSQALLDQIVNAVQTHPDAPMGGAIAAAAYTDVLQPLVFGGGAANANPAAIQQFVVPTIFKLESARLAMYKGQIAPEPYADTVGVVLLLTPTVWGPNGGGLNPAQQLAALQMTSDLVGVQTQWAAIVRNDPKLASQSDPLILALRENGRALTLFSDPNNGIAPDQGINNAAIQLRGIGAGSVANFIINAGNALFQAIAQYASHMPSGGVINPPPKI